MHNRNYGNKCDTHAILILEDTHAILILEDTHAILILEDTHAILILEDNHVLLYGTGSIPYHTLQQLTNTALKFS